MNGPHACPSHLRLGLVVALVLAQGLPASGAKPGRREPPAGHVPLASAPPQKTRLRLPFEGTWGVLQGMESDGTHTSYAAYALDFVPAEAPTTAAAFRQRRKLTAHACYGRPILAPADGRVVWARDGARELPPFHESPKHEAGNFVIIEHAPDELTEFRHLMKGSLAVKVGDPVAKGQVIGRCGNSGNAVTPHLHFAFLGSFDPIATRPMQLSDYEVLVAPGVWQKGDGIPRKGQILRPSPQAP